MSHSRERGARRVRLDRVLPGRPLQQRASGPAKGLRALFASLATFASCPTAVGSTSSARTAVPAARQPLAPAAASAAAAAIASTAFPALCAALARAAALAPRKGSVSPTTLAAAAEPLATARRNARSHAHSSVRQRGQPKLRRVQPLVELRCRPTVLLRLQPGRMSHSRERGARRIRLDRMLPGRPLQQPAAGYAEGLRALLATLTTSSARTASVYSVPTLSTTRPTALSARPPALSASAAASLATPTSATQSQSTWDGR